MSQEPWQASVEVDVSKEAVAERELLDEPEAVLRFDRPTAVEQVSFVNGSGGSCDARIVLRPLLSYENLSIPAGMKYEMPVNALMRPGDLAELWVSPRGSVSSVVVSGQTVEDFR